MPIPRRRLGIIAGGGIAVLLVAIPVLGADPSAPAGSSPSAEASASSEPTGSTLESLSPSSDAPSSEPSTDAAPSTGTSPAPESTSPGAEPDPSIVDRSPESEKTEGVPVTVTGTVVAGKDGQGRPTYTITADGKTWELSDGPPWFWGDKNPLNAYVGKSVTVVGSAESGGTELEVDTVDGKAIREPGKPPWAGGPWVVGPTHPGWKPWMAGGKPGNGVGRENAPGQNKDKTEDSAGGS